MADEPLVNEQATPEKVETPAVESPKEVVRSLDGEPETTETPETETPEAETDAGEPAGEEEPKGEEEEQPKKKLTGSERLKRRLAAAEAENAALRSRGSDGEVSATELEKRIGKPPKEDEYKGDYLAFERALTAYELDKRQVTRELRSEIDRAKTARVERMKELAEDHIERIEEFRATAKDFDTVMQAAAHLKVSPTVEELVIESDKSAQLQYFLAKNPQTLSRLNDMTEREAAREIGRLESKLSLPAPKTTNAPKPVIPPKGGAAPKFDPNKSDNMEDYIKWRKAL